MNNANGGDVLFHFKGDTKDIDKKTSSMNSKVKGLGKAIGTSVVAGVGVASVAVVKFVKDATTSFAEFEQLQGGLEAMLKGNADEIKRVMDTSKTAYKDLQMSQNEYLQSFESSYAIVKNGLSDNADAILYTNKVLQLSADLFNSYGGSTEQYASAINWALKGTFSYLDNLNIGIIGTNEGFVEAANNAGILGREIKNVHDLTSNEIVDVIQHYAEQTGVWGRSTEEASKTIAGSLNMTKSSWQDLINEFGKSDGDIEGAFNNFMTSIEALGTNLFPVLERILNSVISYLPGIIDKIAQALPGLVERLVPPLISSAVKVFQSLVSALPQLVSVLAKMLPGILNSLIKGLIEIVNSLSEEMDTLIPILVDAIYQIVPVLLENMPLITACGGKLLLGLVKGLLNTIPVMLSNIPKIGSAIINYLKQLPSQTKQIGGMMIKGLWEGISNVADWVIKKIGGLASTIIKKVKGIFGVHSPSTEFSFIGRMNMVGLEQGMEDMQPEIQRTIDSLFDLNPNVVGTMNTHFSPNVIVNNNVNMKTDPLGQVVGNIKTFSGGAKNDYNYGMGV